MNQAHAVLVAGEAVRAGLTDRHAAQLALECYRNFERLGVRTGLAQLLLWRRDIDPRGFELLQARVPADPAGRTLQYEGALEPLGQRTCCYDTVLKPLGQRTCCYDTVLEPLAQRTWAYEPVLSPPDDSSEDPEADAAVGEAGVGLDWTFSDQSEVVRSVFKMSLEPEEEEDEVQLIREPRVGETLGDHVLIRVVGRGGMGVVYEAIDVRTGARCALKALTPQPKGDGRRRARFKREIRALRRLEHPGVVRVHRCGRDRNVDWYTMDFIEGRELKDLLQEGLLTLGQRLQIFLELCGAVHHANERLVVHRDLKPGNVLVDRQLHVHVLDFGLARILDGEAAVTRTGAAVGTPSYMAPEQLRDPRRVDARTDVFSLGVILYELLTGRRPFDGSSVSEVHHKVLNEDPVRPSTVWEELGRGADAVAARALEKKPQLRYLDVAALARDVGRLQRGLSIRESTRIHAHRRSLRRWIERNRKGLLAGLAVASCVYLPPLILGWLG